MDAHLILDKQLFHELLSGWRYVAWVHRLGAETPEKFGTSAWLAT
jgi:hypothetical protein